MSFGYSSSQKIIGNSRIGKVWKLIFYAKQNWVIKEILGTDHGHIPINVKSSLLMYLVSQIIKFDSKY